MVLGRLHLARPGSKVDELFHVESTMRENEFSWFNWRRLGSTFLRLVPLVTLLGIWSVGCDPHEKLYPGVHVPSPNRKLVATFYAVGGGGAAGYMDVFVEIHRSGEQRKAWREVLRLSGVHQVCLVWPSDHELSVTYPEGGFVMSSLGSLEIEGGIKVSVSRGPGGQGFLLDRSCRGCLATLDNVSWSWSTCTEGRVVRDR